VLVVPLLTDTLNPKSNRCLNNLRAWDRFAVRWPGIDHLEARLLRIFFIIDVVEKADVGPWFSSSPNFWAKCRMTASTARACLIKAGLSLYFVNRA